MGLAYLKTLIHHDLYHPNGLISIMGRVAKKANDIPAYQEQLQILQAALENWPIRSFNGEQMNLHGDQIWFDDNRIVLLTDFCFQEMPYRFFWVTQGFPNLLKNQMGCLILMFSIESHAGKKHIFPEWFTLFAFEPKRTAFYPQLAFHTVLDDVNFSQIDWNEAALCRAQFYHLPTESQLYKLRLANCLVPEFYGVSLPQLKETDLWQAY
ncbi:hypothetical protein ACFQ3H_13265, partial [Paralysiella testudinis]